TLNFVFSNMVIIFRTLNFVFSNMVIIFIYPVFLRLYILFNILTTPKTTATAFIYLYIALLHYNFIERKLST
ncbi:hypothetical protein DW057_15875, partial [Lachnospira eligens]